MVNEQEAEVSIRRQCELLSVPRSGYYYKPVEADPEDNQLMLVLDKIHLKYPFYGSRKLAFEVRELGIHANRKRIQRLMRVMGIEALVPKPSTSEARPEHEKFPYLLRGLQVGRVNQVWAADITYIPMDCGFVYLVAVMDWHSRRVLSWRISNTLESDFCVDALREALQK